MIYLDNAATTMKKPARVIRAVEDAMHRAGNAGRGGHGAARMADEILFELRETAAELFGCPDPEHVVLTMNATHGINIAIHDMTARGKRIVVTPYEHNAVIRPLKLHGAEIIVAEAAPFDRDCLLNAFEDHLRRGVDGAVVNHVSNVFGCRQPLEDLAALCCRYGVPLLVDASQSAGAEKLDMEALDAAYLAMPGHKGLYGPQGTGLLLVRDLTRPLMAGGTGSNSVSPWMPDFLPDRLEAGTQNLPGAAGLLEGLRFVRERGEDHIRAHETALIAETIRGLRRIPGITVHWPEGLSPESGVLSFVSSACSPTELGEKLAERGFALRAGLHCAPLAHRTHGTLEEGTLRLSVSAFSTPGELSLFLRTLRELQKPAQAGL